MDLSTGRVVRTLGFPLPIDTAFSPDGKRLAVASVWRNGAVFDLETGEEAFELDGSHKQHRRRARGGVLEPGWPIHRRHDPLRRGSVGGGDGKAPVHPVRPQRARPGRGLESGFLSPGHGRHRWHREGVGDRAGGCPGALVAVDPRDEERDRGGGVLARRDSGHDRRRGDHRREDLGPGGRRRRGVGKPSRRWRARGVHAGRTAAGDDRRVEVGAGLGPADGAGPSNDRTPTLRCGCPPRCDLRFIRRQPGRQVDRRRRLGEALLRRRRGGGMGLWRPGRSSSGSATASTSTTLRSAPMGSMWSPRAGTERRRSSIAPAA